MSLAFNRSLNPPRHQELPSTEEQESSLNITVIFTSVGATIAALKRAGNLAASLGVRITLMVPQIVPYPLPLTSPPVLLEFQEKRFREMASKSPVEIQVQLYLCRDPLNALKTALRPHSLLVVGGRRRWWPTREKSWARQLRSAGHEVIFTEMD
jgi:hypothetical protein